MNAPASETGKDAGAAKDEAAAEVAKLLSYILLLVLAAGLYLAAGSLPTSKWEPLGAGAFPRLVMAMLGVLCLVAIILSLRRLVAGGITGFSGPRVGQWFLAHRLVIFVFVDFAIYLAVLKYLGFSVATFLFLLTAQLIVAPRGWRSLITAVVIAVVFSFGLNWLFASVFTVFLPRGLLG